MPYHDTPCVLATGTPGSHGYIRRWVDGKERHAHRIALEEALGRPLERWEYACHTCDNPACVRNDDVGVYVVRGVEYPRFGHLWLGTTVTNSYDRTDKGRSPSGDRHGARTHPETKLGERNPAAKLTEAIVRTIRTLHAQGGITYEDIALQYGLTAE